ATRKAIPKPKYVRRSTKEKPEQAPEATFGKRLKATAKVTKSGKKKQPAKGLKTLSEIASFEAEQMKLAIERSKTQLHSSQPSGKDEDDDDHDDDDERTESDHDDDEIQGANVAGEEMDEEATNAEGEENELYRDVNVNLEGRDVEMTDAQQTNVQTTQVLEDTHVIITLVNPEGQQQSSSVSSGFVSNMLNPRPDTGIDSIFTLNTEATSLVDVPVTTIAEPPLVSATTLPPPPTPLITHMQQTPVPTPTTVPSTSLQDLPNFGSLFGFDHRLKTLETDFSEFKQTNQFAEAVSSIPGIVDAYLANKMNEAVKTAVQLQSDRLRDEAQAKNEDFLNKLDDNIKKIIKNQVKEQVKAQVSKILPKIKKTVNEQLEAEIMTRSSTESKTSLAIAANLSELELKKILIEKMESNKDDEDKDEEPSAGSNRGSKRRRAGKEPESTSAPKEKTSKTTGKSTDGSKSQHKSAGKSAHTKEPMHTYKDLEEPTHQEFDIGATAEQSDEETSQHPDWFQKPAKPPIPDRPRESFDELMDTPLEFSAFMMNRLKIDTLTPELLAGLTFELMKGTCKSLVELEYFFEEVYKATTNRLDWHNPEESTSAPKEKTSKTTGKSTDGSKYQYKSAGKSAYIEEPMHTDKDLEEPAHQEFDIGATAEQSDEKTTQHPDWFQNPTKPPTPDRDWNKTLPTVHGLVQPWLSNLDREEGPRESFNELMDTPLDFSAFMMNRLKIDTLTPELLVQHLS
ncbi:hypothetical protein Tco_0848092, partial [Tanacetum coccineum]